MNRTIKALLFLTLAGVVISSCLKERPQNFLPKQHQKQIGSEKIPLSNDLLGEQIIIHNTVDDVTITYTGAYILNNLVVTIEVIDINTKKIITEELIFERDWDDIATKAPSKITTIQQKFSNKFTFIEISKISNAMENLVNSSTENYTITEIKDLRIQGLFVCNSIFKSIKRGVFNRNTGTSHPEDHLFRNTTNTTHEGFARQLTSFTLSEDVVINIHEIKQKIEEDRVYAKNKGALFFNDALKRYEYSSITFYDFEQRILEYTINNPDEFEDPVSPAGLRWPRGSDHGCCGNYSGPCYYWHPICWAHDKLCTDCEPGWFCFSGCVPD